MIKPLIITMIIDGYIDFIVNLPAPSIVVHGAEVDEATISEVNFGVE